MDPKKKKDFDKSKGKGRPGKGKNSKQPIEEVKPGVTQEFLKRGKNNIEWRTGDKVLTNLVASLAFGLASGLRQDLNVNGVQTGTPTIVPFRVPGILAIRTKLTCGNSAVSNTYNSAANLAFRKIYSFTRHANSGSKLYEAADQGMYFISVGQILGFLGWLQRLEATISKYSATNRYTPRYLCRAMGADYDDVMANRAQLRYLIAWLGRAVGALAFPDMPYFHACYEAYKWIYRDTDSPKEQFYLLTSAGFGKYNPTLTSAGGGVTFTTTQPWGSAVDGVYMTVNDLMAYAHELMDVLLSDEDIGVISGDILKAYREGGLFSPVAFGDYDPVVKDDEALQQIHNCHPVSEKYYQLLSYSQNAGSTNQAPFVVGNYGVSTQTVNSSSSVGHLTFIDAFSKEPDANEVVNCCVLNPQYYLVQNTPATSYSPFGVVHDLHLPVEAFIVKDLTGSVQDLTSYLIRFGSDLTAHPASLIPLTNFDWHPVRLHAAYSGSITAIDAMGDLQNCRFFSYDVGDKIHEAAMLNLFKYSDSNFK